MTNDRPTSLSRKIAWHFVCELQHRMAQLNMTRRMLAERIGVSESAVSQLMNHPGNLSLRRIVEIAAAVGMKPSVILYDDDDTNHDKAPIYAGVFSDLWEMHGKPRNYNDTHTEEDL